MHDAMKIASPHKENLNQFHMKVSYIMTLFCFIYNMTLALNPNPKTNHKSPKP